MAITSQTRDPRPMLKRAMVLLSVVLAALLIWRLKQTLAVRRPVPMLADPLLNHVLPRNLDVPCTDITDIYAIDDRGCRLVTNSFGFKSRHPVAMPKPPGTLRIFFVGDSFVEGMCDNRLTMPEQVEARLQAVPELASRFTLEVVNAGVSSYSTMIYYLLVTHRLLDLAPDLIVVNVDLTDVYDDTLYAALATFDPSGDLVSAGGSGHERPRPPALPQEYLAWAFPGGLPAVRPAVDKSLGWLRRTILAANAAGVPIVVSTTPYAGQLGCDSQPLTREPDDVVRAAAQSAGAHYFDALAALAARSQGHAEQWYLLPYDPHFSIAGNKAWADVFADDLLAHKSELLKPAISPVEKSAGKE